MHNAAVSYEQLGLPTLDALGADLLTTTPRQRWIGLARPIVGIAAYKTLFDHKSIFCTQTAPHHLPFQRKIDFTSIPQ